MIKTNSSSKRPRGRQHSRPNGYQNSHQSSRSHNSGGRNRLTDPRNQVFESNGPEGRIKGNAQQIFDKYTSHARDAASGGDLIMAEAYLQHAEHYHRLIIEYKDYQQSIAAAQAIQTPSVQEEDKPQEEAKSQEPSLSPTESLPVSPPLQNSKTDLSNEDKAVQDAPLEEVKLPLE